MHNRFHLPFEKSAANRSHVNRDRRQTEMLKKKIKKKTQRKLLRNVSRDLQTRVGLNVNYDIVSRIFTKKKNTEINFFIRGRNENV